MHAQPFHGVPAVGGRDHLVAHPEDQAHRLAGHEVVVRKTRLAGCAAVLVQSAFLPLGGPWRCLMRGKANPMPPVGRDGRAGIWLAPLPVQVTLNTIFPARAGRPAGPWPVRPVPPVAVEVSMRRILLAALALTLLPGAAARDKSKPASTVVLQYAPTARRRMTWRS